MVGRRKKTEASGGAGSLVEELLRNRQDLVLKVLDILQGREAKARLDLNGVTFHLAGAKVRMEGNVQVTVTPLAKR